MSLDNEDKAWIASVITESESRMTAKIADTRALIEHVETTLLTEFHKWASPMEQRIRSHREAIRTLDLEIDNHGERLARLEPPH